MMIKEIQEYAEIRTKARAYLCYILSRNISQTMQNGNLELVLQKLDNINISLLRVKRYMYLTEEASKSQRISQAILL